ncbi:MAG: adenylate/guanylate cyclase domain-containing protein [Alphaproteobacteria bacterium]|nr:adenylate/guanylate cyclase domain-containing protein [Alphaproteobacteria bacterium]
MDGARPTRKLAAIVVADIVGYSRLMEADEADTLARLRTIRSEIVEPITAQHRGRVVKTTGDGWLSEFASVTDAVQSTLVLLEALAARNDGVAPERRIELRAGINLGEIIFEGDDIYGTGVNIAARLEALAEPGGIRVSSSVHDQIQSILDLAFEDMGEAQVKNIARPVRSFALRSRSGSGASTAPAPLGKVAEVASIAVLPFANMSNDPEQDYFADGMVEDILTALSRFRSLKVIARNSTFAYKGRAVDVRQVARELGVRYVLEGSVRKAGARLRITGQLIDATSGAHLWADRFDGALEDVFDLQDKITETVVGIIEPRIRGAEIERARRKRPDNLDAYDLYLQSLPHLYAFRSEPNTTALALLSKAIALDPGYAPALAGAAWCYEQRLTRRWPTMRDDDEMEAIRLARATLATTTDDANAIGTAGFVLLMVGREWDAGLVALRRSLDLNPNNVLILIMAGFANIYAGDLAEAMSWLQRARRVSPADPGAFFFLTGEAWIRLLSGDVEGAAAGAAQSAATYDGWDSTYWVLASALGHLGRKADARAAVDKLLALSPGTTLSGLRTKTWPFRHHERIAITIDGLRLAGLPEG